MGTLAVLRRWFQLGGDKPMTYRLYRLLSLFHLAASFLVLGCSTAIDTRSLFAQLTYANNGLPPAPERPFQLYAALELEGVTGYVDAAAAAECYRTFDSTALRDLGEALGSPCQSGGDRQFDCLAGTWGRIEYEIIAKLPTICPNLPPADRSMLAYSVVHMAGTVASFARWTGVSKASFDAVYAMAPQVIDRIAHVLEAKKGRIPRDTINAPVLALSGGSANGAFTAGFLFELLWARERALLQMPEEQRDSFDLRSRFAGLVGTSVGALISQVIDLYSVDPRTTLSPRQLAFLDACVKPQPVALEVDSSDGGSGGSAGSSSGSGGSSGSDGSGNGGCFSGAPTPTFPGLPAPGPPGTSPPRLIQRCALTKLVTYFSDIEEKDLMCIEPGAVTRMVGGKSGLALGEPSLGLMRFDPLSGTILDPILHELAQPMLDNDTPRIVVSVDMQQNQVVGLDERSCLWLPTEASTHGPQPYARVGTRPYCLGAQVMASVVLPFFARPLRHTYSGYSEFGECSTWLDGGLRSAFPVLRALRLSRPLALMRRSAPRRLLRVLAIETGRRNGLPQPRPGSVVDVSLNAIGQMASANTIDEFALAQAVSSQREREFDAIRKARAAAAKEHPQGPGATALAMDIEAEEVGVPDDWSISVVYVPDEVPPGIVADSGYAFDRYVMRGLFTWGRRVAMSRIRGETEAGGADPARQLPTLLGWPDALANKVVEVIEEDRSNSDIAAWEQAYTHGECRAFREDRIKRGAARVLDSSTPSCANVTDEMRSPRYFLCPDDGFDLGEGRARR